MERLDIKVYDKEGSDFREREESFQVVKREKNAKMKRESVPERYIGLW